MTIIFKIRNKFENKPRHYYHTFKTRSNLISFIAKQKSKFRVVYDHIVVKDLNHETMKILRIPNWDSTTRRLLFPD